MEPPMAPRACSRAPISQAIWCRIDCRRTWTGRVRMGRIGLNEREKDGRVVLENGWLKEVEETEFKNW